MRKLEAGTRLVVASHNPGKLREIADLVAPFGLDAVSAGALGLPEPEETETTFAGNARLKALTAAMASGLPALADDSGLAVEALGGEPGVYSARWAGPGKDFAHAMAEVERRLQAVGATTPERRRARFVAVLSLAWPDGATVEFEGVVEGQIVWPPRGDGGFGYDPMFLPDADWPAGEGGRMLTFGEMSREAKHRISHRARAFRQLVAGCLAG
jgi:XTP/dITP diphosphohydrolase